MDLVKFVVWTSLCLALGFAAGTADVNGRTPAQHAQRWWKTSVPSPAEVRSNAEAVVDNVRQAVPTKLPTEQHSAGDRDALQKLIAKRQK